MAQVNEGIALYQEMKTPPVFWPQLVAMNAGAHALAGKVAEGLVLIDDALELAARGDTSAIPEFSLLKGDLLIAAGASRCRRGALVPTRRSTVQEARASG